MSVCLPLRSSASSALKASAGAFNAEDAADRRGNQALHQQKEHVLVSAGRDAAPSGVSARIRGCSDPRRSAIKQFNGTIADPRGTLPRILAENGSGKIADLVLLRRE